MDHMSILFLPHLCSPIILLHRIHYFEYVGWFIYIAIFHSFTGHTILRSFSLLFYVLMAYIANSMDPDETAPLGAVLSGFTVFASMIKLVWSAFEFMQQA